MVDTASSHPAYAALLFLSGGIALLITLLAYQRRHSPGGLSLTLLMFTVTLWNWLCALSWVNSVPSWFFVWRDLSIFGAVTAPILLFVFAVEITNRTYWLSKTLFILLAIEPIATLILVWTDPLHQIFYGGMREQNAAGMPAGGPWFWVNSIYSVALILTAFLLFIQSAVKQKAVIYQKQIRTSLVGVVVLMIFYVFNLFNIRPLSGLDINPIMFTITSLFFAYSIIGYHMLDVTPVALEVLIDQMEDGLIVLDTQSRVIEINRAAADLIRGERSQLIGADLKKALQNAPTSHIELNQNNPSYQEIQLEGPPFRVLEMIVSPLKNEIGRWQGDLLLWRDVTHLKNIENELRTANDTLRDQITEIEALQDIIRDQAIRDPLTGLYNRRYLDEIMPKEIARAERLEMQLAFLMIDLDHFKIINDTYGHEGGDAVLVTLASYLEHAVRKGDVVIRYGGEEFLILLVDSDADTAFQRADHFRQDIECTSTACGENQIRITISVGVALYPQHGLSPIEVLRAADTALYKAKHLGRNRVCRV